MVYWAVTTVLAECLAFTFAFVFWVNWNWSKEMIIKVHRPTHVGVLSFVICLEFVSLHIRSMWETICDAWSCWSGWNFGPNSSRIPPILKYSFRYPPPPENENCQRVQIREFQNTPPKMKIVRVQIWEFQNTPLRKWKFSESPNPRVSESPPKLEKLQISNFRIV